jgi:diguanylate cyclase (GGDEF)-like protein/PAS domain S-box-containing protein
LSENSSTTGSAAGALEELLQFLYLMPVGVLKFRADGAIDLLNPMAAQILMPLISTPALDDIYTALAALAPDLRLQVARYSADTGTILDRQRLETQTGGRTTVLSLTVNRINQSVYMAVLKDVTKFAERERKLFSDQQKFRAIFDHVRDYAIYTITTDGVIEEWNQSLQRYGGWLAADVYGRNVCMFLPQDDADPPRVDMLLAEAQRIGSVETEGWRLKRDGSRLWGNSVITALPDEGGSVRGFVVVSRDMTERKRMEDDMKLLATVDPLTGAYNRRQGHAILTAEAGRYARDGRPFAVLMLDIDHFKAVNDHFGHAAGDAVLRSLVELARSTLRTVDRLVRWGGEEFLMVLPDTEAAAAMAAAERLRAVVSATPVAAPAGDASIRFTVSIGVAVAAGGDLNELLRRSDAALYSAKTGGRNRVVLAE